MAKTLLKLKQLEALANNNRALISDGNGGLATALTTTTELELLNTAVAGTPVASKAVIYDGSLNVVTNDVLLTGAGGVVNFDGGGASLTHSATGTDDKLTFGSGDGTLEVDFNNHEMTNVDINSGAIDGVSIGSSSAALTSLTMGGHAMDDITISSDTLASDDDHLITAGAVKKYVDASSAGLRWMKPVEIATTGELATNHAGVVYDAGTNQLRCATNNQALGNQDGEPLEFNANEDQATRILVKDQAGLKGGMTFTVDAVPAASNTVDLEMDDVYFRLTFVDGASSNDFGGGSGENDGSRKTANIRRNDGSETTSTVAASIRDLFQNSGQMNISGKGTGNSVQLEQKDPKTQTVTNAISADTSNLLGNPSGVVAGKSSFNGIYFARTNHGVGVPWALQRASDAIDLNELSSAAVFVERGLANSDQGYVQAKDVGGPGEDIDTQHQGWIQFTGTGAISATSGMEKDGSILRLDFETTTSTFASQAPAVGDFVALGDLSAAAGTMIQGTVGGMLDLIAGDVNVDSAGASTLAANSVASSELHILEFDVNITTASSELSDAITSGISLSAQNQGAVDALVANPLTQVYFNGLKLKKASNLANAQNPSGDGDWWLKKNAADNNISIAFADSDFADGEDFLLILAY